MGHLVIDTPTHFFSTLIKDICDPLWKNRPLANFHEIRVLGMDRRRIYCRVQQSKDQSLKMFLGRVMAKKLYAGHPGLGLQFFEKRSRLYALCSTFNVSVYAPCHTAWLGDLMDLPGKSQGER